MTRARWTICYAIGYEGDADEAVESLSSLLDADYSVPAGALRRPGHGMYLHSRNLTWIVNFLACPLNDPRADVRHALCARLAGRATLRHATELLDPLPAREGNSSHPGLHRSAAAAEIHADNEFPRLQL